MKRTIVLVFAALLPAVSAAQEPILFVDAWMGGPLDSIYNAEYQRVQSVCQGQPEACHASQLDTTALPLAPVYSRPGDTEPAGWMAVRLRPRGRWPYAGLVFVGADGGESPLLDDLGDWGYGTTLDLLEARDGWIRPWLLEPAGPYWLSVDSGPGFGVVEGPYGLTGRLWRVGEVSAGAETLPAGVYMAVDVADGVVGLRAESPTDMDCSGDADADLDGPSPAIYRIPVRALLDTAGRPAVEPAYPRGC